jgi:hypothetical protein
VVDALSRISHEVHVSTINMYMKYLKDKILEEVSLDHHYSQIKENL